jgi:hypothetical protein
MITKPRSVKDMSAFGRKRTSGRCSLNERATRKRPVAKKFADAEGVSFLRFQNWVRGARVGLYAVFPIAGPILLLFFPRGADTQMQEQALRESK